jgi:hypothetical protein
MEQGQSSAGPRQLTAAELDFVVGGFSKERADHGTLVGAANPG